MGVRYYALLAGGALIAGAGLVISSGAGPGPAAKISDTAIDRARETATFEALGGPSAGTAGEDPKGGSLTPTPTLTPTVIELDKVTRDGDHYVAPAGNGRTAILTLDPELQTTAEKLLAEAKAPRGAIVAMAPDGRILALAGWRGKEPKGGKDGAADWHLATDAWAPAASVFKLVTASALVGGGVQPDDKVCYHGGIRSIVESNLHDDKHDNQCNSLTYGVAHSNNAILGKLAFEHLEPTALDQLAHQMLAPPPATLGFAATSAELALPAQKDLAFAQAAAGFNGAKLSVLGGALLAATFADDGEQPEARIIESIVDSTGPHAQSSASAHHLLTADVAKAVGKMMVGTCDFGSAAKSFRRASVKVAGKTGTLTTTQPFYMENSWFVGYAPADKPEIIVSVVLGNPENWHLRGHEAAKRLLDRAVRRAEDRGKPAASKPLPPTDSHRPSAVLPAGASPAPSNK